MNFVFRDIHPDIYRDYSFARKFSEKNFAPFTRKFVVEQTLRLCALARNFSVEILL